MNVLLGFKIVILFFFLIDFWFVIVFRFLIYGCGLFCIWNIVVGEMVIEYFGMLVCFIFMDKWEKYYESKVLLLLIYEVGVIIVYYCWIFCFVDEELYEYLIDCLINCCDLM